MYPGVDLTEWSNTVAPARLSAARRLIWCPGVDWYPIQTIKPRRADQDGSTRSRVGDAGLFCQAEAVGFLCVHFVAHCMQATGRSVRRNTDYVQPY